MARKSKRATLEGKTAESFFHENKRGKRVFRAGWDAKLASAVRRAQDGTHDQWDAKLLGDPAGILADPKVAGSEFFQKLLAEGPLRLS